MRLRGLTPAVRRDDLADALREARTEDGRLRPDYGGRCIEALPETALAALGVSTDAPDLLGDAVPIEDAAHVVLLVLDGFGFHEWQRYEPKHSLLSTVSEHGTVSPLTSVFPTGSTPAMTTIHTGRQPVEHGLIGGLLPVDGRSLSVLVMETHAGTPVEPDPSLVLPESLETVYEHAEGRGVDTAVLRPVEFFDSVGSRRLSRGAEPLGYDGGDDLARTLAERVDEARAPSYTVAYYPATDGAGHAGGSASERHRKAVGAAVSAVEQFVGALARPDEVAILLTADHGQVQTVPARNPPLDTDEIEPLGTHGSDGRSTVVHGGARSLQFHTDDPAAVVAELPAEADWLAVTGEDVPALFGDRTPSDRFRERQPDLVALPRRLSVWVDDEFALLDKVGMHGGLAPEETLVPLGAAWASDLR